MLQPLRCAALLLLPALAFSQIVNNSVTVTASQPVTAQPDQAVFGVVVTSGLDKALADIVIALQGTGITSSNFVGINNSAALVTVVSGTQPPSSPPPQLQWNFQLVVPISKVKDTTASLAALATKLPQNNSGLSLTFSLQGTETSQSPGCNLSDLVASARTQAQQLASAAGLLVGLIQSLSTSAPGSCLLTVRFALGTVLVPSQPNSITITATQPLALQPDEVSITLTVTSSVNSGLDDITAALQQAGISGASFTGVNTVTIYTGNPATPQSQLQWSFTLTAPLSKITDTFTALNAAQQALSKSAPPLGLSFLGASTLVSPQLTHLLTCPDADLFKDAQTEAQQVAAAAGVSAGAVLSISGANLPSPVTVAQLGDFASGAGFASFLLGAPTFTTVTSPSCSMTVSFQLLQ